LADRDYQDCKASRFRLSYVPVHIAFEVLMEEDRNPELVFSGFVVLLMPMLLRGLGGALWRVVCLDIKRTDRMSMVLHQTCPHQCQVYVRCAL